MTNADVLLKTFVVHFVPHAGAPFLLRTFDAQTADGAETIAQAMAERACWQTWYLEEVVQ